MFKLSISYTLHRISHPYATSIFDTVLTAFHQCHAPVLKIEPQVFKKVIAFVRVDGKMRRLPAYFVNPVYGQLCDGHQNVIYSCCF